MLHKFRKKWSQNFLIDDNISKKIINLININNSDTILEIGPGEGSLTKHIIQYTKKIHLVEIDPILCEKLNLNYNHESTIRIFNEDILDFKLDLLTSYIIVGNIPYNITTPIIFKFLNQTNWTSMILMVQTEVANRIVAQPKSKIYGRLSVMCQAFSNVSKKFDVSKNVFFPKPKVDSSVITFTPKKHNIHNIENFSEIVKKSFSQRRKKLKNNLSDILNIQQIDKFGHKRAEELSVDDYIEIGS